MKTSILITALLALPLTVSACGFTPLHTPAPGASFEAPLPNMDLQFTQTKAKGATGEKAEFLIRQALTDRMSTGASSPYALKMGSRLYRSSIGIRSDDVATRYDMILDVNYRLVERATGKVVDSGRVKSVSTFNAPTDPYGRTSAQNDAEKRVARDVSDRLILKITKALRAA